MHQVHDTLIYRGTCASPRCAQNIAGWVARKDSNGIFKVGWNGDRNSIPESNPHWAYFSKDANLSSQDAYVKEKRRIGGNIYKNGTDSLQGVAASFAGQDRSQRGLLSSHLAYSIDHQHSSN